MSGKQSKNKNKAGVSGNRKSLPGNRNKDSEKKVNVFRNFVVLAVISLFLTFTAYRSLNIFQYALLGEPMTETESKGFNINGTVHGVSSKKNYIIYNSANVTKARDIEITLNSATAQDTTISVAAGKGNSYGKKYDVVIPAGQNFVSFYVGYKNVNSLKLSSTGDLDIASVTAAYTVPYDTEGLDSLFVTRHNEFVKGIFALLAILLVISAILCGRRFTERIIDRCAGFFKSVPGRLRALNRKKTVIYIASGVLSAGAGILIWYAAARNILKMWNGGADGYIFGACAGILIFFIVLYFFGKIIKFENLFLILGITVSLMGVSIMPNRLNVSWDDQVHYMNILSVSKFHVIYTSVGEYDLYLSTFTDQLKQMEKEAPGTFRNLIDYRQAGKINSGMGDSPVSWKNAVYIPPAVVMFFARAFFPLTLSDKIVKFSEALFFFIFVYLGMRKLKYGKAALAAVSLIPTVIFIICNFNYDYWPLALITYSTAYIVSEYQRPEKVLEKKDLILIYASYLVALIVKPVYLPVLAIAAFFPAEKFKDKKTVKIYRGVFIGLVIAAAAGASVLMAAGGLGRGDLRGGDVNPAGQIRYIFSNPLKYTKQLMKDVRLYLRIPTVGYYMNDTAYIGPVKSRLGEVLIFWLLAAVLLDRRKEGRKTSLWFKIAVIPLAFAAVCCTGTAMYVMYTPVKYGSINGFQGRYLMPVLAPVVLCLSSTGFLAIPYKEKTERIMQGSLVTVSLVFLMCVFSLFVTA